MHLFTRLPIAVCFALIAGTAIAAAPNEEKLLLEIRNVPAAEQDEGGRFANDEFREKKLVSLIRNNALFIATSAEAEALRRDGFAPNILMKSGNLVDLYRRGLFGPEMKLPDCYHTYEQIVNETATFVQKHPQNITRLCIGETTGSRHPIYAWRISADARAPRDKPVLLFEAAIHSDEILGTEIVMALFNKLIDGLARKDKQITDWLNDFDIYLIPVINVDGHQIVTSGRDPRWRKNTRDVNGDGISGIYPEGVDLNRGFDFNWAMGGTSEPDRANYRGEAPFSEAENRSLRAFALDTRPLIALTYHSQGEIIFYPWAWNGQPAPDDAIIKPLATAVANSIATMDGTGTYAVSPGGPSSQTYPWFYGRLGTIDLIIETGKGAHIMPPKEVPGIIAANLKAVDRVFERAYGPGLAVRVLDARDGTPLEATVWLPQIENETVDRRKTNPRYGRLYRLLNPGEYRVIVSCPGYRMEVQPKVVVREGNWTELEIRLNPET